MLLVEIPHIKKLIETMGLKSFYQALNKTLIEDFKHWKDFDKSPRHAVYVDNGVIELMPICGKKLYSFKYVNGHPNNAKLKKPTIYACGLLADVASGEPLMIAEMNLLTALRTAATAALASSLMAKPKSKTLAIIGCGAQSDFQVLAHHALFNLHEVHYFDLDPKAMKRFANNMKGESFKLIPGKEAKSTIAGVDIIITATAAKKKQQVLNYSWLTPGQHICGIGGDSPGKTELDIKILKNSKIVVEYFPQSSHEGEIQNLGKNAKKHVYAELWELVSGKKNARKNAKDITLFDSVGFALEDYSILRLVYDLVKKHDLGRNAELTPEHMENTKDLFSLLKTKPVKKDEIAVIGYASGIAANNPDCGLGPIYMHHHKNFFRASSYPLHWHALLEPKIDTETKEQITAEVLRLNTELAEGVEQLVKTHQKICVLAGDHSSAIGTWSGIAHAYRQQGDIGLVWIDAHMDSHTHETSPSGNIHGMPAAVLLGHGLKSLTKILDQHPKLKPENLCLVGIRSYEKGEATLLENLGVKIFFIKDIEKQGLDAVMDEAIKHVSKNTYGFGMTIDLDAIDPNDAPGVGCREDNGIPAHMLLNALAKIKTNHPFVGLEITEYNPILDHQQKTAKLIPQLIEAVYGKNTNFL